MNEGAFMPIRSWVTGQLSAQSMASERKVVGGIVVRMVAIAALTGEGETLTLTDSTAARARLGSVAWANVDHSNLAF